jgi:hypothetical protein
MSYGNWNARSPEDVQRYNGRPTDFEVAKQRYESIKPLIGKRKALDVRPLGKFSDRNRAHERIVKISDTEYYLSCTHWNWNDREIMADSKNDNLKPRAITLKQEGEVETIIIHRNRFGFTSPSIYYFYEYNLPVGMGLTKHRGTTYVSIKNNDDKYQYYTLNQGDVTFYRPKGGTAWTPLHVYREVKHKLNRTKTKAIREKLKTFVDYAKVMFPLVEPKGNSWGSVLDMHWADFVTLKNPDEIPESWLTAVANYKQKLNHWNWTAKAYDYNEAGLIPKIQKEAYRVEKPFDTEVVPLGEMSNDPYKSWI